MRHVASLVMRQPCDVRDCELCTAESHQDFNHVEYKDEGLSMDTSPRIQDQQKIFPPFSSSSKSKRDFKKRLRASNSSAFSSARVTPGHVRTKSASPRYDNPYEEEFIEELLVTPKRKPMKSASIFPYIHPSPPTKTRRIKISAGPPSNRRTISASGIENPNLRTLFTKSWYEVSRLHSYVLNSFNEKQQ